MATFEEISKAPHPNEPMFSIELRVMFEKPTGNFVDRIDPINGNNPPFNGGLLCNTIPAGYVSEENLPPFYQSYADLMEEWYVYTPPEEEPEQLITEIEGLDRLVASGDATVEYEDMTDQEKEMSDYERQHEIESIALEKGVDPDDI